jgi:ABC-type antimicrobial peptide transport system permease subunit
MAHSVTQRTKEIGIRMTMGAQRGDVMQLILAQSMRPVAIGAGVGLAAGASVSRVWASLLYGVSPLDPMVSGACDVLGGCGAAGRLCSRTTGITNGPDDGSAAHIGIGQSEPRREGA